MFKKTALLDPELANYGIIVKVEACGVNFKDVVIATERVELEAGRIFLFPSSFLFLSSYLVPNWFLWLLFDALGLEGAGTIVSVPENEIYGFKVGDKVFGLFVCGLASHTLVDPVSFPPPQLP